MVSSNSALPKLVVLLESVFGEGSLSDWESRMCRLSLTSCIESRCSGTGGRGLRSTLGDLSGNGKELDGACGSGTSSWFTRDSWIRFIRFPMRAFFASSDCDVSLVGVESAKTSSICSLITVCLVFLLFAFEVGHSIPQLVHRRNPLTVPAFSPTARGEDVLTKLIRFGA